MKQLAVFGGQPLFSAPRHVNRPTVPCRKAFAKRADAVLESGWFSNQGPLVSELERRLSEYLGVRNCVLTANGTIGMELLIKSLKISGEVIMPSYTFVATANAFLWHGLKPVFCDVDPHTQNIDPALIEARISPRTSALVGVHLWGQPCATEKLQEIARKHGLALIFDAAHAFACKHNEQFIGGFGDAEVFSLHATKVLHSGEGGAVTTNDDALAERLRVQRNFGFVGFDQTLDIGVNAKMPELSAALGLSNFDVLDEILQKSENTRSTYRNQLVDCPALTMQPDPVEQHNHHYTVMQVDEAVAGLSRDQLIALLHAENIFARRYFYPGCHRLEPYGSMDNKPHLPVTEALGASSLVLPSGSAIESKDVLAICDLLQDALARGDQIGNKMTSMEMAEGHPG